MTLQGTSIIGLEKRKRQEDHKLCCLLLTVAKTKGDNRMAKAKGNNRMVKANGDNKMVRIKGDNKVIKTQRDHK